MIRINLLPVKDSQRALGRRQQMSLLALGAVMTLLIMVLPYVRQGWKLSALDAQIEQVNSEIQRLNMQVREVRDLDRLKREVEAKLQIIQALNHKRVGPSRVLDDLSLATPDNLWLIDFSEAGGAATCTGLALDNETIARFMRQLQASPYFHSVDLVETSQQQDSGGQAPDAPVSFTRFIIKAGVDYFGRDGKPPEPPPGQAPARGPGPPAQAPPAASQPRAS
ncbi:MAG: PilN domain-containing protein [Candidatus Binatia bacterium]